MKTEIAPSGAALGWEFKETTYSIRPTLARDLGLIPAVKYRNGHPVYDKYAKTKSSSLPKSLWMASDRDQAKYLNAKHGFEGTSPGYTWYHHQTPVKMLLVQYGVHAAYKHDGGQKLWVRGAANR